MFSYPNGSAGVTVAGRDLMTFHAKLASDYEISGPEISLSSFQGRNRSTLFLLQQSYGALNILLPIDFYCETKGDTMDGVTRFNAAISGLFELDLGDGFLYSCLAKEIGAPEWINDEFCSADYELIGIRHKPLKAVESADSIPCESTYPRTDCRITIDSSVIGDSTSLSVALNGATWVISRTFTGDVVLDGITKTYTDNTISITQDVEWTDFPYLVPGDNALTVRTDTGRISTGVTVEYYPTFI